MTGVLIITCAVVSGFLLGAILAAAVWRDQRREFVMHVEVLAECVERIAAHTGDGRVAVRPVLEALTEMRRRFL